MTKTVQCGSNPLPAAQKKYGTTIITHGWQGSGNRGEWTEEMAKAILKRANNKGRIGIYNAQTGHFDFAAGTKDGETILVFDWASESNNLTPGYSEAAGDALFAALLLGQKRGDFKLENLHFIGHSRGCVVHTECVERLLRVGLSVDQLTNLDPHDWGGVGMNVSNDWDNHPGLTVEYPTNRKPNNGVIAWQGVTFMDTYWQANDVLHGDNAGLHGNVLDGRPVSGTYNVPWTARVTDHSDVHAMYLKTINNDTAYPNGYKYSRLAGMNNRPPADITEKQLIQFNFFKPLEIKGKPSRIRGIVNGSFDRNSTAGWGYHGGGGYKAEVQGEEPPFNFVNGFAEFTYQWQSTKPMRLVHNRFFVPSNAGKISFKMKTANLKSGKLVIRVAKAGYGTQTLRQKCSQNP